MYKDLKNHLPSGASLEYEVSKIPYTLEKDYNPDFTITTKSGNIIYIEAKGLGRAFTYDVRAKMEAVKKNNPELDIRIVFMRDGPLRKGGKMRASDWAEKAGYPFCVGTIPKDWFEE